MKLSREQKNKVKELVAAGLTTDQVNEEGAKFNPPFNLTRTQVDGYRSRVAPKLVDILKDKKLSPLREGLAIRENRIALLQELAEQMIDDLTKGGKGWVVGKVQVVDGQPVEIEEFNHQEMNQLRGVLDDIAKEIGARKVVAKIDTDTKLEVVVRRIENERTNNS